MTDEKVQEQLEEIGRAAVAVKQASNRVKEWGHLKALELRLITNGDSPYWEEYEAARKLLVDLLEQYCPYREPIISVPPAAPSCEDATAVVAARKAKSPDYLAGEKAGLEEAAKIAAAQEVTATPTRNWVDWNRAVVTITDELRRVAEGNVKK